VGFFTWDDLMQVFDQISEKWTEMSAIDEIKLQRKNIMDYEG